MKEQLQDIASLKGMFPFRLGATSYIIPDNLAPNVEFLAPLVDDVELVLFESDAISNLPDAGAIRRLGELKRAHGISYTVHLPLDAELGSSDETIRRQSVEKCRRVVDLTGSLDPFGYLLHFHGEMRGRKPARDFGRWKEALDRSARELLADGADPKLFCAETLDYPFELVEDVVDAHGLSVCLDVGHLVFYGYPIREHLIRYLPRAGVIHLHGNCGGEDHKNIGELPPEILPALIESLSLTADQERVLTMEIFGYGDFVKSMDVMRRQAL